MTVNDRGATWGWLLTCGLVAAVCLVVVIIFAAVILAGPLVFKAY